MKVGKNVNYSVPTVGVLSALTSVEGNAVAMG